MKSAFAAQIAVLLMPSSAMAQASAPADQRPKWAVQIAPGECTLLRTTGGSEPSLVRLNTYVGTGNYTISLAGSGVRPGTPSILEPVQLRVDGKVKERRFGFRSKRSESGFTGVYVVPEVATGAVDALAAGQELEVRAPSGQIATMSLSGGAKAFAAFRTCEAEQLIEWGADPVQFQPGGTTPLIKDRDRLVPIAQLRQIKTLQLPIKTQHYLVMSTEGVVEKCGSVHEIPKSNMEQIICTYLTGRRIGEPARDQAGKAVRGVITIQPSPSPDLVPAHL